MEKITFRGKELSPGTRITLPIGLVVCVVMSSIALAWTFVVVHHPPKAAHAAGILTAQTKTNPWGVALDTAVQHLWIAEPGCDASPVCGSIPPQGAIGEYDSNLNKINDFTPPTNSIYNPVFIALDKSGNLWFTDPTHGAIGELIPGGNTWAEYSIAKTFRRSRSHKNCAEFLLCRCTRWEWL